MLWFVLGCRAVRTLFGAVASSRSSRSFSRRGSGKRDRTCTSVSPRSAATRPSALASDPRWNTRTSGGASATRGRGRTPWDSRPWWRSARRCPVPTRPAPRTFTAPMSCDASYKCRQTRPGSSTISWCRAVCSRRRARRRRGDSWRRNNAWRRRERCPHISTIARERPPRPTCSVAWVPSRAPPRAWTETAWAPCPPRRGDRTRNDWRSSNASSRRRRRRSAATSRSPRAWAARWVKTPCASRTSSACPGKRYEATSATWRGSCRASRSRVARLARTCRSSTRASIFPRTSTSTFCSSKGGRTQRRRQARKGLARGGGDAFQG